MGRLFGLVLLLLSLYVGMTLYTEGIRSAFGGAFAPIAPGGKDAAPVATHLTPLATDVDGPSDRERRVWITDAVREQVRADMQTGARRRGY
jgi:hypothetical protein